MWQDWRVWCPKHAPHIPSRVTAGPFSGIDLNLLRQGIDSGSAEASGKKVKHTLHHRPINNISAL